MPPPKDPDKAKEWRRKLSVAGLRRCPSKTTLLKRSASMKEAWKNPEFIELQKEIHLGSKNPNYKKKVEKVCPVCNEVFFVKPSHSDQICCTKKCMGIRKSLTDVGEHNNFFGKKHSSETVGILREKQTGRVVGSSTKDKMSVKKKGVPHTKEHSDNIGKSLKGREITWTDKISAAHQGIPLDEWEGYTTPLYHKIRTSQEYYNWRLAVFERDNFRDWFSGVESRGNLNAHHIVPFAEILDKHNITTFEEALLCEELWDVNNGVTMIDTSHAAYHQIW